jgi:hypothetical protein
LDERGSEDDLGRHGRLLSDSWGQSQPTVSCERKAGGQSSRLGESFRENCPRSNWNI